MSKTSAHETLNIQVDKLSEAIESMMKGFETLQTPKILKTEMNLTKPMSSLHIALTGDSEVSDPDSFCEESDRNTETNDPYLHRISMINEDFRAFEARNAGNVRLPSRSISNLLEEISKSIYNTHGYSLPFTSTEEFIQGLQEILKKSVDCSIVDLHSFIISLCETIRLEEPTCTSHKLGDTLFNLNIKSIPRKRFQKADSTVNYDTALEKMLEDNTLPDEVKKIGKLTKNFLVSINLEQLKVEGADSLMIKLEQQTFDLELKKKKMLAQMEALSKFSKQLRMKDVDLIKVKEDLQTEAKVLEEERGSLIEAESQFKNKINDIRIKIYEACPEISNFELKPRFSMESSRLGRLSPLVAQIRNSSPAVITNKASDNNELSELQDQLILLESQPQDSGSQVKINRLKTQIASMRSSSAINKSLRNSVGALKIGGLDLKITSTSNVNHEHQISSSPLARSCCSSPAIPDPLMAISNSKRTTLRPPGPRPLKSKQKESLDEIEIAKNQLKLQESRLKERETLIDEKENRLMRTWMRLPNADELENMVQKEIKYLNIIRKDYEDKFDELNVELVTFATKNEQIRLRERELENRFIEISKEKKALDEEKKGFETKFQKIIELIENL